MIISLVQFFKNNIKYPFCGLTPRKAILQGTQGALELNPNPNFSNIIIIILLLIIFSDFHHGRRFFPTVSTYIRRLQFNLTLQSTCYPQQKSANDLATHKTSIKIGRFLLAGHYSYSQAFSSAFSLHQTTNQ